MFLLATVLCCLSPLSELLSKLSSRFHVPLPPNLSPEELVHFKTYKLDRIQIRVCSVLKNWLDEHWMADFQEDPALKKELQTLINSMLENSGSLLTSQLAKALNALLRKKERTAALSSGGRPAGVSSSNVNVPPKLLISSKLTLDSFDLMQVDATELARQLTLMDFDKFRSIQPRECLNQNWSKPLAIKSVLAPNILAMISQFNKISLWVELTILKCKELKHRIKFYERFLKIAEVSNSSYAQQQTHTSTANLRKRCTHAQTTCGMERARNESIAIRRDELLTLFFFFCVFFLYFISLCLFAFFFVCVCSAMSFVEQLQQFVCDLLRVEFESDPPLEAHEGWHQLQECRAFRLVRGPVPRRQEQPQLQASAAAVAHAVHSAPRHLPQRLDVHGGRQPGPAVVHDQLHQALQTRRAHPLDQAISARGL